MTTAPLFDYIIYIGRFQPFHNGHLAVLKKAMKSAKKVIVLIGSASRPRTIQNPWSYQERCVMIQHSVSIAQQHQLLFAPIEDALYNDEVWVRDIQYQVDSVIKQQGENPRKLNIALIGHEKDKSSYYLQMFPQWKRVEVNNFDSLSATQIREYFFSGCSLSLLEREKEKEQINENMEQNINSSLHSNETAKGFHMLIESATPKPISQFLHSFTKTPHCEQLIREYQFIQNYKSSWSQSPYSPTFVVTDAIVVHSGHVLLVKRGNEPGKGLWAFPGGFVEQGERLFEGCLRELREETQIALSNDALKGALKGQKVFDHPNRSQRGRTISHAFLFEFLIGDLPSVCAADDAQEATWVPLSDFADMQNELFDDHFDMGCYFLGL